MDYSRMGGVKANYGKVKTRNKGAQAAQDAAQEKHKADLLARMKKAAQAGKSDSKATEG